MPDLYIDGAWVASGDRTCSPVVNPSDGSIVTEVDVATDEQVQAAIAAARRAFDTGDWPRTTGADRAVLLTRVADLIDRDQEAIAREETLQTGKAMRESRWDIADVARVFRYYAGLATKDETRTVDQDNAAVRSRIAYEPVGVCALIAPWNYPLLQLSWKVAPALAAGNTVVMKPASVTPLTAVHLTRLLEEAGIPAGVVNLVLGPGGRVGQALADSTDVDLISLTGRHRGRTGAAARRGRQHEEGRPRTRRQEPEHRLRRRRLRHRRGQRADRRVHPLRAGLLGRLPGHRPGRDLRPLRGRGRPSRRPDPAGPRASTTRPRPAR